MEVRKVNRVIGEMTAYDDRLWDELERFSYDTQSFYKLYIDRITRSLPTTQTVTASGGVTLTSLYIRCESNGGAVNITANPQIAVGFEDGERLTLEGTSDTNTLQFDDGNGLSMSASVILGDKDILEFTWNNTASLWIMAGSDTK